MPLKPPRVATRRPRTPWWDREDMRFAWRAVLGSVPVMLAATLPTGPVLAYKAQCRQPEVRAGLVGHPVASLRCAAAEVYAAKHWWVFGFGCFLLAAAVAMLVLLRWMPAKERARRESYYGGR